MDLSDEVEHRSSDGGRSFLGCIVAHHRDQPALIGPGKKACMVRRPFGTGDAVAFSVQHDGRHWDLWLRRELPLYVLVSGVAGSVAEPMAVGVDNDVDEIRIVE